MSSVKESDGEGGQWQTERARLRVWLPAPTLIALQFGGQLDQHFAQLIMAPIDRLRVKGRLIDIFNDWQAMEGYETDARMALTDWARRIRPQLRSVHILQRSKIVSMGISVANLALGGLLKTYTDRDAYQRALEATTIEARARPAYGNE